MSDETIGSGATGVPALPDAGFVFDRSRAALVVIDPQNDFLSPDGAGWALFGHSVTENDTVANLARLFEAAESADLTVAVSPHYHYPVDGEWRFGGPAEQLLTALRMFERSGPLTVEGLPGSGADFLEELKRFILDGSTIIASPHKMWGPESNDLALQLRKRNVTQIVLAGMAANLCVESHLRHLLEEGFEVVVVRDATAAPRVATGDAYLAALTNYSFLAQDVWTTEEAVSRFRAGATDAIEATWEPHEKHGRLTTRNDLPDSVFAFPHQRKEPLTDPQHVRSALTRFGQVIDVSDAERALAFANIQQAARYYGVHLSERDWHELAARSGEESTSPGGESSGQAVTTRARMAASGKNA